MKTFLVKFPAEEDQTEIKTFEGEIKAARRKQPVGSSGLQTRKSLVTSTYPGKGFGSGFFTSFHYSAFHPSPG
ncbi:MAG: hypothetical protein FWC45_07235 [Treponema sp.]|nr:hypothetical protein [Treponema sp.]